MKNQTVKQIVIMGMLAAVAFVTVALIRVPVVAFLKYEPKDVIITIGGFLFGPFAAFLISLVVSFVEMFTISDTGWIGLAMNIISSCAFACTAAAIYKKHRTLKGALIGLLSGLAAMVAAMMLWNYFLTPIYMGTPRETVASMLPTVFLPFNLIKGALNAAIAMLLYKPLVTALRKMNLVPASSSGKANGHRINAGVIIVSLLVIATSVILILILSGVIG